MTKYKSSIILLTLCIGNLFITCNKKGLNNRPVAVAGEDQNITLPTDSTVLSGIRSTDPDGNVTSFRWSKVSGPASCTISEPTASKTLVKSLVSGVYKFELNVTDNGGLSSKDTVQITVTDPHAGNMPPIASAGPDIQLEIPKTYDTLFATATDHDGNIKSYSWRKISGPDTFAIYQADSSSRPEAFIYGLIEGTYTFEFTATDNYGLTGKDTVSVTVFSNLKTLVINNLAFDYGKDGHYYVLPDSVYAKVKHVFVKGFCTGYSLWELADKGPNPNYDYSWGGYYYELLPASEIVVRGCTSPSEEVSLKIYY